MPINTALNSQVDLSNLVVKVASIGPDATTAAFAATVTKLCFQLTTEALVTAAAASQALTITLAGVSATDMAFVQYVGGTNTRRNITVGAVTTANTVTITIYNNEPTNALNGTLIFNVFVLKA
jgi:hypothetical protein